MLVKIHLTWLEKGKRYHSKLDAPTMLVKDSSNMVSKGIPPLIKEITSICQTHI